MIKEAVSLTFASVYSGVGGADLGFTKAGWACQWQCERDPWRRKLLKNHWPTVPIHEDVFALTDMTPVDMLYGETPNKEPQWIDGYIAVVATLNPAVFILETSPQNVTALSLIRQAMPAYGVSRFILQYELGAAPSDTFSCGVKGRACLVGIQGKEEEEVKTAFRRLGTMSYHSDHATIETVHGFPIGWFCLCMTTPCQCDHEQQQCALAESSSPIVWECIGNQMKDLVH